jgi:hypothetical protein
MPSSTQERKKKPGLVAPSLTQEKKKPGLVAQSQKRNLVYVFKQRTKWRAKRRAADFLGNFLEGAFTSGAAAHAPSKKNTGCAPTHRGRENGYAAAA